MNGRQFEQTPDGLWLLGGDGSPGFELDKPAQGLITEHCTTHYRAYTQRYS